MDVQPALSRLYASIRPITIAVIRRDDGRMLVTDERDPVGGERFHPPLGGGAEYGERSEEALRREPREVLGAELQAPCLLGVPYPRLGTANPVF
jgi:ADP-ribose pyrophosphatase YjhB (NUDIX family)